MILNIIVSSFGKEMYEKDQPGKYEDIYKMKDKKIGAV